MVGTLGTFDFALGTPSMTPADRTARVDAGELGRCTNAKVTLTGSGRGYSTRSVRRRTWTEATVDSRLTFRNQTRFWRDMSPPLRKSVAGSSPASPSPSVRALERGERARRGKVRHELAELLDVFGWDGVIRAWTRGR